MYAIETRMEGTAQVFVDLLIQVKGDISSKGIFCSLIEEYKAGDASDVRRDLAALSANAIGGLRAAHWPKPVASARFFGRRSSRVVGDTTTGRGAAL